MFHSVPLCVDIKLLKFTHYMADYGTCIPTYFPPALCLRFDVLKTCVKLVTLPNIFVVSYRVVTYCFELIPFSIVIVKAVDQNGTKIQESEKLYAYSIFIISTAFAYPSLADY